MDGSTLSVTASVARALPYLVKASQTGYLWIDQVTIDQRHIVERNEQVRMMGDIYSQSFRCMVWIDHDPYFDPEFDLELNWNHGPGEDVLNFFRSFNDDDPQNEWSTITGEEMRRVSTTSTSQSPSARRKSHVRDHLLWFFEHPWFRRTWVYQEFVLAPQTTFLIGHFELPGDEIERVFRFGWLQSASWFDTFHHRLNMSKTRATLFHKAPGIEFLIAAVQSRLLYTAPEKSGTDLPFTSTRHVDGFRNYEVLSYSDMLEKMGGTEARDSRDHVYAFIGLAPCLLNHMRVDYSLSVEETFAAMMKALVKESKSLDFFSNLPFEADIGKSRLRLPSWVPDWTIFSANIHILCHDNMFNACGSGFGLPLIDKCKHVDSPSSAWNELMVAGKIIDTVQFTLRPFSAYQAARSLEIDFSNYSGYLPWEMSTLDIFMAELNERGVAEGQHISTKALLRTLLMDGVQWAAIDALNSGENLYRTDIQTFGRTHHEKVEDVISVLVGAETVTYDSLPHEATLQTLHDLSKVQYHRRVACCAKGILALTPDLTEKGDQVAILHGSRAPVVLRARPNGKFIVIGQCYYDGAMYGDMADPDDDNADTFILV
jgi:hypothetical protein